MRTLITTRIYRPAGRAARSIVPVRCTDMSHVLDAYSFRQEGTANLIIHMLTVDRKWIHPLPMDTPIVIPDTGGVSVTLIEANHCPGSCLFFFEGPQTVNAGDSVYTSPFVGSPKIFRYLHCGDFRASPQHVLHPAVREKYIDHIYLDTTYLDPKVSQLGGFDAGLPLTWNSIYSHLSHKLYTLAQN